MTVLCSSDVLLGQKCWSQINIVFMVCLHCQVLGLDLRASAFVSLLPWIVMAVGSSAAGALADGLVARGVAVVKVRKVR